MSTETSSLQIRLVLPSTPPPPSPPVLFTCGCRRTATTSCTCNINNNNNNSNSNNNNNMTAGGSCCESMTLLRPYTDAEMETMERQRWRRLVREGWFHQSVHYQRWDEEALGRGSSYRPHLVAARTTVRTSTTTALVLSLNFNPDIWTYDDNDYTVVSNEEEVLPLETSHLYVWRTPALLPGDKFNILNELGKQLERQYRSLSKRSFIVCHCHNARPEDFVRSLTQCRQQAGTQGKVILHYGGYGVPRPRNGSLYLVSPSGDPVKYSLDTLRLQVGFPLVMIADCANAVSILNHLLETRKMEEESQHLTYRRYGKTISGSTLDDADRSEVLLPSWGRYDGTTTAINTGVDIDNTTGITVTSTATGTGITGTTGITATGTTTTTTTSTNNASLLMGLRGLRSGAGSPTGPLLRDDFFFIGATTDGELPEHPMLPSDILTSCLTTPVHMALLWFIAENAHTTDIHPLHMYLIPGSLEDKKTPLGQLQWAFMSITESIAWSSFPYSLFMHLFREDIVVAPLFRGFLLAERIITALGGTVTVYPPLPRTNMHTMWDVLDNIIDRTLASLQRAVQPVPPKVLSPLEFREWLDWSVIKWRYEQGSMSLPTLKDHAVVVPNFLDEELRCVFAACERITEQSFFRLGRSESLSLEQHRQHQDEKTFNRFGESSKRLHGKELNENSLPPFRNQWGGNSSSVAKPFPFITRLPMLLQGLLVMAHRDRATELVCRFVDAGPLAVAASAEVGIFNLALVHYWSRRDLHHLLPALLFIYTKACYTDPSLAGVDTTQRNVVLDKSLEILSHPTEIITDSNGSLPGAWQHNVLGLWVKPQGQQLLAASLLTMLCLHSGESRRRCCEQDALHICCKLLHNAANALVNNNTVRMAMNTPFDVQREDKKEGLTCEVPAEGEEEIIVGGAEEKEEVEEERFWDSKPPGDFDTRDNYNTSSLATMYILSLIALLVSLTWENGPFSPVRGEAPERNKKEEESVPSTRVDLSIAIKALRLLLWASPTVVRGASLKALTVIMMSPITDKETALECIQVIAECGEVHVGPREGNTDNRLEFVAAVFLAMKWLIDCLSTSMSIEEIRQAVHSELTRAHRPMMDPSSRDNNNNTNTNTTTNTTTTTTTNHHTGKFRDVSPSHSSSPPHFSSTATMRRRERSGTATMRTSTNAVESNTLSGEVPLDSSSSMSSEGINHLLGLLTAFANRLAVSTQDPCPYVAAHSRKVLLDDFSFLQMRRFFFSRPSHAVTCYGRVGQPTKSSNSGIAHLISDIFSTFTSRGGKQDMRGDGRQSKIALRNLNEDSSVDSIGTSMKGGIGGGVGGTSSGQARVSDTNITLRAISEHDNSTITSFVFTLLSFLSELLLVPLDDSDPRHPFNLDKDAHLRNYLRRLRDGLRISSPVGYGLYETDGCGLGLSPLFPPGSTLLPRPPSFMQFLSLDDEGRGRTPLFSPLVNSTASFITGGDTPRTSFKERDLSFQLLCEKNTFVERDGHIQVLTFHPTDRHFITGTDQGVIQVWSLPEENEYSASTTTTTSTKDTSTSTSLDYSHLLTNIQVSDVVARPDSVVPPSCVLRYMYSTPALVQRGGNHSTTICSDNIGYGSKTKDDPLTGLHLVDAAYRTLLCAVSRSGSVHLFSSYTNAATVRRVTSFWTMTREESLRSHQCLSSYHVPAMLLHLCGANGSITSWDLEYEHRVSTGVGCGELRGTPSIVTSHPNDAFTIAVGATSVYLYDLRNPSSATHILRDPTVSGETQQQQQQQQQRPILGDYSNSLCLHIGFSCRYPHGIVTGYGGEQGVVMLWDDRHVRHPLCQAIVSDAAATSTTSTLSSVRFMDIQHYSSPVTTMSVTADALFITDALAQFPTTTTAAATTTTTTTATSPSLSSSGGTGTISGSRTHIRLTQQPGAASFHPILPLCGVVTGNSLQLYGRKRKR